MPARDLTDREGPKLRHEFVGMMFAVTIGEVGLQTAALVRAGHWMHYLPAYSHLLVATIAIAASWVGWSLSASPGVRHDVKSIFQAEFLILLLDVALVIAYFILVRSVDFAAEGDKPRAPSAKPEAVWILTIFVMYLIWDLLTKGLAYRKQADTERLPWWRHHFVRIVPTVVCVLLGYFTKNLVQDADAAHVVTADLALLGLVLLFRSLKDVASAISGRAPLRRALFFTTLWVIVLVGGITWTRKWPIPERVRAEIETPPERNR